MKHLKKSLILKEINEYPDFIVSYFKRNFFPDYAQYIVFLEKRLKRIRIYKQLSRDLNWQYVKQIKEKKIFGIVHRVFDRIFHRNGCYQKIS